MILQRLFSAKKKKNMLAREMNTEIPLRIRE